MKQANALSANWGQTIFQSANEIAANTVFRKRLDEIQAQTESEKAWWEKRRAAIQKQILEWARHTLSSILSWSNEDTTIVETPGNASSSRRKKGNHKAICQQFENQGTNCVQLPSM